MTASSPLRMQREGQPFLFWSKCGGIRRGEDIRLLRLTSKLVDLRKGYANSFRATQSEALIIHTTKKEKVAARACKINGELCTVV